MISAWPAVDAAKKLVGAWDVMMLTDPPRRAQPEADLREAIRLVDQIGDFGGPIPTAVLRAARHLAHHWLCAGPEIRAGVLQSACAATLQTVQAYLSGTIETPLGGRPDPRARAAGERS